MTLWLKVRRVQAVLLPGLAAFTLITAVAHDQYVRMPSLLSAGGDRSLPYDSGSRSGADLLPWPSTPRVLPPRGDDTSPVDL